MTVSVLHKDLSSEEEGAYLLPEPRHILNGDQGGTDCPSTIVRILFKIASQNEGISGRLISFLAISE